MEPTKETWLDLVAAVPGIGLRITHRYQTALHISGAIAPILDRLQKETGFLKFDQASIWDLDVSTNDGRQFQLHTDNILVQFSYQSPVIKLRAKDRPSISLPPVQP